MSFITRPNNILQYVYKALPHISPGREYYEITGENEITKYITRGIDVNSFEYLSSKEDPFKDEYLENLYCICSVNIVTSEKIESQIFHQQDILEKSHTVFYKSYEDALFALDEINNDKDKKHEDHIDAFCYLIPEVSDLLKNTKDETKGKDSEFIPRRYTWENGRIHDFLHDSHLDDVMKSAFYLLSPSHPIILDEPDTFIEDVLKVFDDGIKKKDDEDIHKDVCRYLGISDESLKDTSGMIIRVSTFDDKYSWMDEIVEKRKKELGCDKITEFIKFKPVPDISYEKICDIGKEQVITDVSQFFPSIPKFELPVINIPKLNLPKIELPGKNAAKNVPLGKNGITVRIESEDCKQELDPLRIPPVQDYTISDVNLEKVNRCGDIDESPHNFVLKVLKDRNDPNNPHQKEFNMSIDLGSMCAYNSKMEKVINEREQSKLLDDIVTSYDLIKPGFYYKFYHSNKRVYVSDITYIKSSQMVYVDIITLLRKCPERNWYLSNPEGKTIKMEINEFLKKFTFESRIYEDSYDLTNESLIEFNELKFAVEYLKYIQQRFDDNKPLSYFTSYPEMFYFINKTRSNLDVTLEKITMVAMDRKHEVEKTTIFFYRDVIDSKIGVNYETNQRSFESIELKDFFNTFNSCVRYDDIFNAEKAYRKIDINFKTIYPIKSDTSSPCYMGIQFVKFYNEYGLQEFITQVDSFIVNTDDGEFLIYDIVKVNNSDEIKVVTHNGNIIYLKELDLINKAILIIKRINPSRVIGTNKSYICYSDAITPSKENIDGMENMILKVNWLGLETLSRIYKRARFLFFNTFTNRYSVISYEKGKIYIDENDDYTSKISCIIDNIQDGRLLRLDNDLFEYWSTDYTDGEK